MRCLRSEVLNLTVGRGVQLDRPVIDGATLFPDALNPLAALSGAKVIVRYRPMQATDQIKVDDKRPDGYTGAGLVIEFRQVEQHPLLGQPGRKPRQDHRRAVWRA